MSTYNKGPEGKIVLSGTVPEFGLIRLVSGEGQVTAGTANNDKFLIGVALEAGVSGDTIPYLARNTATFKAIAGAAIAKGVIVYTGASGKITETVTSLTVAGVTLEASTADGDIIEVARVAAVNDDIV